MTTNGPFKIFIGIDQTGAVTARGPKPLIVTLIDARKARSKIYIHLRLNSLTHADLVKLIEGCVPDFKNESVLIAVDSVFGLPEELDKKISEILRASQSFSFEGKTHGAKTAHAFFHSFLQNSYVPQRRIDQIVKANSVFNLIPYQRNIGCGSYRVLRDLAHGKRWFSIWPFEKPKYQFVVAEAYPTYLWKQLLNVATRDLDRLHIKFPKLKFRTVDDADSFILAKSAEQFGHTILSSRANRTAKKEGWVLGVPFLK